MPGMPRAHQHDPQLRMTAMLRRHPAHGQFQMVSYFCCSCLTRFQPAFVVCCLHMLLYAAACMALSFRWR